VSYHTDYKLDTIDKYGMGFMDEELEAAMSEEDRWGDSLINMPDWDSCSWYDHETDMREFSKRFPDILFKLRGEGAESGDIWAKYFKDGKMQDCQAEINIPPYDESKLA